MSFKDKEKQKEFQKLWMAKRRNEFFSDKSCITCGSTESFQSWSAMKERCLNEKHEHYKYYGAKGVTICDQWINSFECFLRDMGERPVAHTIDRIDPEGNYEPSNCRWADALTQGRNKRKKGKHYFDHI